MFKNDHKFTAYMADNNLDLIKSDIAIDEDRFEQRSCYKDPAGAYYWSLEEHDEDKIILNGCGGDKYVISRPGNSY